MTEGGEACHTCAFHETKGWQKCKCTVCHPNQHQVRCLDDGRGPCVFYRPADKEDS